MKDTHLLAPALGNPGYLTSHFHHLLPGKERKPFPQASENQAPMSEAVYERQGQQRISVFDLNVDALTKEATKVFARPRINKRVQKERYLCYVTVL